MIPFQCFDFGNNSPTSPLKLPLSFPEHLQPPALLSNMISCLSARISLTPASPSPFPIFAIHFQRVMSQQK